MSSTGPMSELEAGVRGLLSAWALPKGSHILAACSGGPDSTCLLHVLAGCARAEGWRISAVYVDHGIRTEEETRREGTFVRELCSRLSVGFHLRSLPPGQCRRRAEQQRASLEEVARRSRYGELTALAEEIGADFLAVGHNFDDHIETLIMRFFWGSGVAGLRGIAARSGRILRPLLGFRREDIFAYLQRRGIGFCSDRSNYDTGFLRNRVRHVLVPVLEEVFPGYERSVAVFGEKMTALNRYLEQEEQILSPWRQIGVSPSGGFRAKAEEFLAVPGYLRVRMLFRLCDALLAETGDQARNGGRRIPYRFLRPVMDTEWFTPPRELLRGHGVRLGWRGEDLFLVRDVVGLGKKGYFIEVLGQNGEIRGSRGRKGRWQIPGTGTLLFVSTGEDVRGERFVAAEADLRPPLVVRSRRPGDSIGMREGAKSVKKLLGEWKVPEERRWKIPLICDQNGTLAVMGGVFGFANRIASRIGPLDESEKKTPSATTTMTMIFAEGERGVRDGVR